MDKKDKNEKLSIQVYADSELSIEEQKDIADLKPYELVEQVNFVAIKFYFGLLQPGSVRASILLLIVSTKLGEDQF